MREKTPVSTMLEEANHLETDPNNISEQKYEAIIKAAGSK